MKEVPGQVEEWNDDTKNRKWVAFNLRAKNPSYVTGNIEMVRCLFVQFWKTAASVQNTQYFIRM